MGSQQQGDLISPLSEETTSPLVLNLTDYEINAIGQAIVGIPNPDLSMFPPHLKEGILINANHYVERILGNGHPQIQASLAPYAGPLLKGIEGTGYYSRLEKEILELFKEPGPKIAVLVSLGKQDEARKVAADSVTSLHLEDVVGNYELAEGRTLDTDELRTVSERYLLENKNHIGKIEHILKAHQKRGIQFAFGKEPKIIGAVLDDANSYLSLIPIRKNEELERSQSVYRKTLKEVVSGFVAEKTDYLELARQCIEKQKPMVAALLGNVFLEQFDPVQDTNLKGQLETLAQKFLSSGNAITGKKFMDTIGMPFSYENVYADFIRESTLPRKPNEFMKLLPPFGPSNLACVLLQADKATLSNFAADSASLVTREHADLMQNIAPYADSARIFVYRFAINSNKKIGNTQEEKRLTSLLDEISSKSKIRYSEQITSPQHRKTEPQNLGERLLADSTYVGAAWIAYETRGLSGIRDLTQQWADRYGADAIGRADDAHPIEILTAMFDKKELPLDNHPRDNPNLKHPEVIMARRAIVEYQLTTGEFRDGIGAQTYHDFMAGKLEIPNPERLALGVVGNYTYSHPFSARQMLENAEVFQKHLPGSKVPENLYRMAAADALKEYASQWLSDTLRGSHHKRPSYWYPAFEHYQKIGHKGLVRFVEVNFRTEPALSTTAVRS